MTWKMSAGWLFGLGFVFSVIWDAVEEYTVEFFEIEKDFEFGMVLFAVFCVGYMYCTHYLRGRYQVKRWSEVL